MAQKKVSETLKQQRKANREFLELKKMQNGEISPGPKPSEVEIRPKTFTEKVKNIWYHDKVFILIGVACAALFIFFTVQCAMKVEPDLQVIVFSYNGILDESCTKIEEYITPLAKDLNGDGTVKINVVNCSYNKENSDYQYANTQATRLQAMMVAEANAVLYITDDETYKYLQNLSENTEFFDGESVALSEDFYEKCKVSDSISLPEGLSISCRKISETTLEKEKNIKTYVKEAKSILDKLK